MVDYNIIQDNTTGVAIADAGGSITHNLIQDNNAPGPGGGNGVEFFGGSAGAWDISYNHFTNNTNEDVLIAGGGESVSNVAISHNVLSSSGGIALLTSANTLINDNVIANSLYDAIALIGGNNGVTITGNTNTDPNGAGINVIGDYYSVGGPDINVSIGDGTMSGANSITGATTAGIILSQGSVTINRNTLSGDGVGILTQAFNDGTNTYSGKIDATIEGNSITGNTTAGIEAAGLYNSFTTANTATNVLAQNNTITGDGEGVVISNGAKVDLGHDPSDLIPSHADFTGLGSSTGNNILTGYTGGAGHYAIDDQNTPQGTQPDVLAENNNFGPYSVNNPSAIAQVINDHHDNSSLTTVYYLPAQNGQTAPAIVYVNLNWAGTAFGTHPAGAPAVTTFGYNDFSDIQSGINAVASGGTVEIYAGTYDPSNILVPIPVTIQGASESSVIITPSLTDSHDDSSFGGTASNGFIIASSGVTIEDLTLDGGAGQDFRDGIITNSANDGHTYNNITIQHVTVDNANRKGIAIYNYTGLATGIVIEHNTLNDIGTTSDDYEGTAAIAVFGSDATIEDNVITNSAAGIEGNTFDDLGRASQHHRE